MGVSGQVEKEELLLLVFALGWASSLSPPDIVERLPFNLGEECDYLVCLQLLNFGSQKCQYGLPSSVGCRDRKHSAVLLFVQSRGPILVCCLLTTSQSFPFVVSYVIFMVYSCV